MRRSWKLFVAANTCRVSLERLHLFDAVFQMTNNDEYELQSEPVRPWSLANHACLDAQLDNVCTVGLSKRSKVGFLGYVMSKLLDIKLLLFFLALYYIYWDFYLSSLRIFSSAFLDINCQWNELMEYLWDFGGFYEKCWVTFCSWKNLLFCAYFHAIL